MARQVKTGLDYFPLNCVNDDKLDLIEAEFGITGFGVIIKLWRKIYSTCGYYCEWNPEVALLFSRQIDVGINAVEEIIKAAIRRGIFDDDLFKKYSILTSNGIQYRYLEATVRRKQINFIKEYLLLADNILPQNVNIYSVSDNILPQNVNTNSQSKVKKKKVKESKENEPSAVKPAERPENTFISLILNNGNLHHVLIEDVEHYHELYPAVNVEQELRHMCGWLESNPSRRKTKNGIKKFITNWLSREQNKGGVNYGRQPVSEDYRQVPNSGAASGYKTKIIL